MTITHVQLLSVPVADQDRAKDFYTSTVGLEVLADQPGVHGRWLQVAPKGADTSLVLVDWFPGMPPGSLRGLLLRTTDIDADCARLRARGVEVDGPKATPWGRQATFADPDGNVLALNEGAQ
ncbi:VOC family protein [Streptomyces sp. NPDC049555]|uniref:VOC family protein n=1 Tax=Streptomyces sp. NPDC049555 TaxID=3154930 RepID=UPI0034154B82